MKNASLTRRVAAARLADAPLDPVAESLEAVLDAERLAGHPAEQHAAEHVQRARVAPREREVHADHERDQAEPGEHAPLKALGQAPAEQHADERAGQDRRRR